MTDIVDKIAAYYEAAYKRYRQAVLSGKRITSNAERLKVERQERDLTNGILGYRFDLNIGLKPLVWMALNLRFPLGEKRGKPMQFSDWQAYDVIVLFGWVRKDNSKRRRFQDAFFEVARKNGKSTFVGAILDYLAFGEIKGARCYVGATSLDQADETFSRSGDALLLSKGNKVAVANSKNNKVIKYGQGVIKAIAAEPKDGKLAYGAVIDEYHQHKDNSLINSIRSGNVSDQQSLLIRITTAGVNLNGVCHEEYKKCKRVLGNEIKMDRYFISIYELDQEDNPDDPKVWEKANPNWGVSVDRDSFMATYEYSRTSESDMIEFKTKNLNMWCHSLSRWANLAVWCEKCRWMVDEKALRGKLAYGALDLSAIYDFTAFTLDFPIEEDRHVQLSHFWIAEAQKDTIARACRIPLDRWIKAGWVTATPGDVIDYDYIRDYINEAYETYKIPYIAADRWRIEELVKIMPAWFPDVAFEFSQGLKTMSPCIRDYERTYLEGKVSANGNEVIDWMMGCAEVFQDSSGNIKLVKPKRRTGSRIDGVITSVMALSNAKTNDMSALSDNIDDLVSGW